MKQISLLVVCVFIMLLASCSDSGTNITDGDGFSDGDSLSDGDMDLVDTADQSETSEFDFEELPFPDAIAFDELSFKTPAIEYRPWVRWWWPGNDVEVDELKREVNLLVDKGFGGAEVQAFNAALDPDVSSESMDRRLSYDTPAYYENLIAMLDEAEKAGLAIDLTLGSGWATGGTHISKEQSMQTMFWSEHFVSGATNVTLDLTTPDMPVFYSVAKLSEGMGEPLTRYLPDDAKIVEVLAAKVIGGNRTEDKYDLKDQIKLQKDSVIVLTDQVSSDNMLDFNVPDGDWVLITFYMGPDGGFPSLAALPEKGFVMNHFDKNEVSRNLEHFLGERTGLADYLGSPIRGFFTDSFELKVERFFCSDFFDEFESRRGYDIKKLLPAVLLPGADNHIFDGAGLGSLAAFTFDDADKRLQYDYQLTVSELFIERFAKNASDWAEQNSLLSRMQNYGLNVDVIRAAGAAHIPEAEQLYAGGTELFLKLVSSGGHSYGRNLISAESLVWAGRDYTLTPLRMKAAVDKLFTAGINHILYHGFPYTLIEGYTELGWTAFSSPFGGAGTYSSNISEANPYWQDMQAFNGYVSRTQLALRAGRPMHDVLVYYPFHGFPASFSRLKEHAETLFNGRLDENDYPAPGNILFELVDMVFGEVDMGERGDWLESIWPKIEKLHYGGYSFDWINSHRLNQLRYENGRLYIGPLEYKSLVLYDIKAIDPSLAAHLAKLAKLGAAIVIAGDYPKLQPGYFDFEKQDKQVLDSMQTLVDGENVKQITVSKEWSESLASLGFSPTVTYQENSTVYFVKRKLDQNQSLLFFRNSTGNKIHTMIEVEGCGENNMWLNSWNGTYSKVQVDNGLMSLDLSAFGSKLLLCGKSDSEELSFEDTMPEFDESLDIVDWKLSVSGSDVPDGSVTLDLNTLIDWRDNDKLKHSSSTGHYSASFTIDDIADYKQVFVQIDQIAGAADIKINDNYVARLMVAPYIVEITNKAVSGENKIELDYTPPLINRLVGLALDDKEGYGRFSSRENMLAPTGVMGQAKLGLVSK